jgi:hypothetical protein
MKLLGFFYSYIARTAPDASGRVSGQTQQELEKQKL